MPKFIVILLFLSVIYMMGSALYYMMRDTDDSKRTVQALTMRVALSILAVVTLLISAHFGWIKPNI